MKKATMDKCEELGYYASLDSTEWGEVMLQLINLRQQSWFITPELVEALDKEITNNLEDAKKNAVVMEESETTIRTYKYLKWS